MWLLLVFYALAACMWTVWLWMAGLRVVPAAQGGVFTVMLPVSAAMVGVLVLGESLGGAQLLALALALAGEVLWPPCPRGKAGQASSQRAPACRGSALTTVRSSSA